MVQTPEEAKRVLKPYKAGPISLDGFDMEAIVHHMKEQGHVRFREDFSYNNSFAGPMRRSPHGSAREIATANAILERFKLPDIHDLKHIEDYHVQAHRDDIQASFPPMVVIALKSGSYKVDGYGASLMQVARRFGVQSGPAFILA